MYYTNTHLCFLYGFVPSFYVNAGGITVPSERMYASSTTYTLPVLKNVYVKERVGINQLKEKRLSTADVNGRTQFLLEPLHPYRTNHSHLLINY